MEVYSDSLYMQNQLLNHKLYDFVPLFDNQIDDSAESVPCVAL